MNGTARQLTASQVQPNEIFLTVMSGPEAGVSYKLVGQTVNLGRSSSNDVVLQDEKSSRHHAKIEKRGDNYWVMNLQSKMGILVNGRKVDESILKLGDVVMIGMTTLRFGTPATGTAGPVSLVNSAPPFPANTMNQQNWPQQQGSPRPSPSRSRPRPQAKSSPAPLLIIVGVIIAGALYINSKSAAKRQQGIQIKGDSAFEQQMEDASHANEDRLKEITTKGKDTQVYEEAQAFYLRGFREFREENYLRAIQNFQAALALYPEHPLARRYLERSRLKNEELITGALERGEKAFQLERYNLAYSEYRTVMLLAGDPNNRNYQLAKKRRDTILLILQSNK